MNSRIACTMIVLGLALPVLAAPSERRSITFEERVAAQRAIEQVYWNHRIWPKDNPTPKPPLSAVVSEKALRRKVGTYLEESNAMDQVWRRPISSPQLQAELDRMVRSTRDPDMLRELFAALGNDAPLIAETLGRQTLADRLARGWYASDERFHDDVKRRAETDLASCSDAACMRTMGGRYTETTWKRRTNTEAARSDEEKGHHIVFLDAEEWKSHRERLTRSLEGSSDALPRMSGALSRSLEGSSEALPRMTLGRLRETPEGFSVSAILSESSDALTTASVVWDKQPFEEWWRSAGREFGTTIEVPSGEYSITATTTGGCTVDTWSGIPRIEPRTGHSAVWTGTEMIIWGGQGSGTFPNTTSFNSGGRYDPMTDSWRLTSTGANVPQARRDHVAVWTGTKMIVWGGYVPSGNGVYVRTGGRYDPLSDTWQPTSIGSGVPVARDGHAAVWTGSVMIVWGGSPSSGQWLNSGSRYNPSNDTWSTTPINVNTPGGVSGHTAVWTGTQMIVWGGYGSAQWVNIGGRYDPSTNTWQQTSTGANVPQARRSHTAVWTGSEMIVWGGSLQTGGRYNPSSDSWVATPTGPNTPSGRSDPSSVWTGTEMIVWGGSDGQGVCDTGGRYSPSTGSWLATLIPKSDQPAGRQLHTAVWTGTEMIVWGGESWDGSVLRTGGRYTLATGSWLPVSSGGGGTPSARRFHTAVWTGTEMIVWGGDDGSGSLDSGGRYNPSNNSWHATTRNGACPTGRILHTAVWTGTQMIVWGGDDVSNLVNTGGRYTPSSDSWTATSLTGPVPSVRARATAVWTGSEMIVWGGSGLNSGGRYSPSTNSWQATSQGGSVPEARSWHTAVWTGNRMIVWGGFTGTTSVNTGGSYDPTSDTWKGTSVSGQAPSARSGHSAVWTGTEMIVWAGETSDGNFLNSGGRYNPSNESWLTTSTANYVPIQRMSHTAIWTGSEMIVWGGVNGFDPDDTRDVLIAGGRYCADSCASPPTLYPDADGDSYGNPNYSQVTCANPPGWVANAEDCDDTRPEAHPGATEVCNGLDDDCDVTIDEDIAAPSGSPSLTASRFDESDAFLLWSEVPNATGYDIIVGDLALLHASGGDFTSSTAGCVVDDHPYLAVLAVGSNPPGGVWYLVRAVNACSGNASYDDGHQQGNRDAEIAASSQACP